MQDNNESVFDTLVPSNFRKCLNEQLEARRRRKEEIIDGTRPHPTAEDLDRMQLERSLVNHGYTPKPRSMGKTVSVEEINIMPEDHEPGHVLKGGFSRAQLLVSQFSSKLDHQNYRELYKLRQAKIKEELGEHYDSFLATAGAQSDLYKGTLKLSGFKRTRRLTKELIEYHFQYKSNRHLLMPLIGYTIPSILDKIRVRLAVLNHEINHLSFLSKTLQGTLLPTENMAKYISRYGMPSANVAYVALEDPGICTGCTIEQHWFDTASAPNATVHCTPELVKHTCGKDKVPPSAEELAALKQRMEQATSEYNEAIGQAKIHRNSTSNLTDLCRKLSKEATENITVTDSFSQYPFK